MVKQWGNGVKLDGMSSVRGCDERPLFDPEYLVEKAMLLLPRSDVLDDRVREHEIERFILERQRIVPPYLHVLVAGKHAMKDIRLLKTGSRNLLGIWIERVQEVVARPFERAVGANLEHAPVGPGWKRLGKMPIDLALLVS
jgi:hypothetical protein